MQVKEIMNKVITIKPDATIKDAADLMSKKRFGCLVVVDEEKIVGIITERDILSKVEAKGKSGKSVLVKDIMSEKVVTTEPNENIDDAALLMSKNKIKKLPVIDNDKLVGIITSTDIIKNSDRINESYFFS